MSGSSISPQVVADINQFVSNLITTNDQSPDFQGSVSTILQNPHFSKAISQENLRELASKNLTKQQLLLLAKCDNAKKDQLFYSNILNNRHLKDLNDLKSIIPQLIDCANDDSDQQHFQKILGIKDLDIKFIDTILTKTKRSNIINAIFNKLTGNETLTANSLVKLASMATSADHFRKIVALQNACTVEADRGNIIRAILNNPKCLVNKLQLSDKIKFASYVKKPDQLKQLAATLKDDATPDNIALAKAIIQNENITTIGAEAAKIILEKQNIVNSLSTEQLGKLVQFASSRQHFANILASENIDANVVNSILSKVPESAGGVLSRFRPSMTDPAALSDVCEKIHGLHTTGKVPIDRLSKDSIFKLQKSSYFANKQELLSEAFSKHINDTQEKAAAAAQAKALEKIEAESKVAPPPPISRPQVDSKGGSKQPNLSTYLAEKKVTFVREHGAYKFPPKKDPTGIQEQAVVFVACLKEMAKKQIGLDEDTGELKLYPRDFDPAIVKAILEELKKPGNQIPGLVLDFYMGIHSSERWMDEASLSDLQDYNQSNKMARIAESFSSEGGLLSDMPPSNPMQRYLVYENTDIHLAPMSESSYICSYDADDDTFFIPEERRNDVTEDQAKMFLKFLEDHSHAFASPTGSTPRPITLNLQEETEKLGDKMMGFILKNKSSLPSHIKIDESIRPVHDAPTDRPHNPTEGRRPKTHGL